MLAPSPVETHPKGRTFALMTKAVGKFGLRQGPESKRHSTGFSDLPFEEQEAIARERRRFAKDIRACLDACALDESRRRLQRSSGKAPSIRNAPSVHGTMNGFDFEVYAFAPLLIQLSNYLPFARRKEPWARTCPHHGIILAELGQAFVTDTMSSAGDRMQALEIFGLMVRHWSADNADEEVERWTWLLRAMLIPDRTLRNRAFTLLDQCLHADSSLPRPPEMPHTASQFQTVALELLTLLHAIESRGDASNQLQTTIDSFIRELANGDIIPVSLQSIAIMLGEEDLFGDAGGLEKELLWVAVATAIGVDPQIAKWLLSNRGSALQVRVLTLRIALHGSGIVAVRTPTNPACDTSDDVATPFFGDLFNAFVNVEASPRRGSHQEYLDTGEVSDPTGGRDLAGHWEDRM